MPQDPLALVTGGAGFIGSHLVRSLLDCGYRVRVLDNLSGCGSWRRIEDLLGKIQAIHGDLRDADLVAKAVDQVDVIFHKAALVSVPESVAHPQDYHAVDATATLSLLEAARRAKVRRIIYSSTSAIYGNPSGVPSSQPKSETMRGLPLSPYGIAKYAGELYMSAYAALHGMQTISLRYFNVFGPGQDPKSQYGAAIPNIVSKIIADESPTIYGDGEQTRDFCHVANVVHANLLAAANSELAGQVVNIGCGISVSVNRIVKIANDALGKNVAPIYLAPRPGDVRDSLANIELAGKLLGYRPVKFFEQGLRESIAWHAQ